MTGKAAACMGGAGSSIGAGCGAVIYLSTAKEVKEIPDSSEIEFLNDAIRSKSSKLNKLLGTVKKHMLTVAEKEAWNTKTDSDDSWKAFTEKGACGLALFPDLALTDGAAPSNTSVFESTTEGEGEGCVFVRWNKTEGTSKWKGVIKLEWVLKKGDEAFLSYISIKNSEEAGKVDIYLKGHSLKSENKVWTIKHTKEHEIKKETTKYPKSFKYDEDTSNRRTWDFVVEENKACAWKNTSSDCSFTYGEEGKTRKNTKAYVWLEESGESNTNKFSYWSDNFQEWWDVAFKTNGFNLNQKGAIKGIWKTVR